MVKGLEDLEKQFILKEDMEYEDIKELVSRLVKFCQIDDKGFVVIKEPNLIIPKKIMLILSARYLANKIQQKLGRENIISEEVTAKELSDMLRKKDSVIIARIKDLKDDKKIVSTQRGIYKVTSYSVKDFIVKLEGSENE